MHPVDCPIVDNFLKKGATCSDASMVSISAELAPNVEAVICCREAEVGADQELRSVPEIASANAARHSLLLRYYSKRPRLISFKGRSLTNQITFLSDMSGVQRKDFGKECTFSPRAGCAEMMIAIDATPTGQAEFIAGTIELFHNESDGWPREQAISYELRLAASLAGANPAKK